MATSQEQELRDSIKRLVMTGEELYSKPCKVVSVDVPNLTCECESMDGLSDYSEVKLNTVYAFESGLNVFPKVDSIVLVTFISKELAYVSMFSEVESIMITISDTIIEIDKGATNIKVGSTTEINATSSIISLKTGATTEAKLESSGITLKCNGQSVGALLDGFFTDLASATVITPSGPGTFNPSAIASFVQTKVKMALVLKS